MNIGLKIRFLNLQIFENIKHLLENHIIFLV